MDIIVRDVEEVPEQAPEPLEPVLEPVPESAPESAPEPPPEPVAKKKGRPLGSKDVKPRAKRPQIVEAPAAPPRALRAKVVYEDPEPPPLQRQASLRQPTGRLLLAAPKPCKKKTGIPNKRSRKETARTHQNPNKDFQ